MKTVDIFKSLSNIAIKIPVVARSRVVAAIVYQRDIISTGWNQYKTHPLQDQYKKNPHSIWLHAEIDAIRKVRWFEYLNQCTMYVCRIRGDGLWGLARPCENGCMGAIESFGFKNVIYTLTDKECIWDEINFTGVTK